MASTASTPQPPATTESDDAQRSTLLKRVIFSGAVVVVLLASLPVLDNEKDHAGQPEHPGLTRGDTATQPIHRKAVDEDEPAEAPASLAANQSSSSSTSSNNTDVAAEPELTSVPQATQLAKAERPVERPAERPADIPADKLHPAEHALTPPATARPVAMRASDSPVGGEKASTPDTTANPPDAKSANTIATTAAKTTAKASEAASESTPIARDSPARRKNEAQESAKRATNDVAAASTEAGNSSSEASSPNKEAPARPAAVPIATRSAMGAIGRFLLPVGFFYSIANAEELRQKLESAGIPVQIETRVQAGPFATRQEAELAREKLLSLGLDPGLVKASRK